MNIHRVRRTSISSCNMDSYVNLGVCKEWICRQQFAHVLTYSKWPGINKVSERNVSFLQFSLELHRHILKLDLELHIVIHSDVSIQQTFTSALTSKCRLLSRLAAKIRPNIAAAGKRRAESLTSSSCMLACVVLRLVVSAFHRTVWHFFLGR